MEQVNKPFKIFSNCIPVKGHTRSTICDLQRKQVKLIPNDLYTILTKYNGHTVEEVKAIYKNEFDEIIDEYFDFLTEHELIFFTDFPEQFPEMPIAWYDPFEITHAILDFSETVAYSPQKAIAQLHDLHCRHLEIRLFGDFSWAFLKEIIQSINKKYTRIITVDFLMKYQPHISHDMAEAFLQQNPRVHSLCFYSAPSGANINTTRENTERVFYNKADLKGAGHCGEIAPGYFSINIKAFTESLHFNSCLNGKISVDCYGAIKNCPAMERSYGNINTTSLKDALGNRHFKDSWHIKKEQISICSDCEFRHICSDCRAFLKDPHNTYSKPLKCGYDPYTGEWNDWEKDKTNAYSIEYYHLKSL
ncbi:grasp-with-spasm system SPASM domain peptide maturase [Ascidiimonas aurantiaca]|uniref:grasp-with-spasm system SPASM domain peptide maturase n=1 Tax=Ascidiimonas aurantiaca TaxID=1685432 RepID=UPI0030ED1EC0